MNDKIADKYRPFKAVIFDADGVVIDTQSIYLKADSAFLNNHNVNANSQEFEHLLTGVSLENGTKILQDLFKIQGNPGALLQERINTIKTFYKKISFVPGFLNFFADIKALYKTAVATSSNTELFTIAEKELNLHKLFDGHIYFLKDVGNISKPAPDIYLHAAKQLGTEPVECLVIEDAPNGILAAKNAGMKCVALATTHDAALLKGADKIVKSYAEINLDKFLTQ